MELEVQLRRDVAIRELLIRKPDIEANGLAPGFIRAAVGGLHNARSSARGNHKAVPAKRKLHGPLGQHARQLSRLFIVARHFHRSPAALELHFEVSRFRGAGTLEQRQGAIGLGLDGEARRAKEYDSILNLLAPKARQGLEIFGHNSQRAAIGAVEKFLIFVG